MNDSRHNTLRSFLLAVLAVGMVIGCNNTITPFDTHTGFFSLYGFLDLDADTNFIRVKDLNRPPNLFSNRELDVKVTLENLDRGIRSEMADSVVLTEEQVYTHNFWSTLEVHPSERYRVTVEDPEGNTTRATATAPLIAEVHDFPALPTCEDTLEISFHNVSRIGQVNVEFGIKFRDDLYFVDVPVNEGDSLDEVQYRLTPKQLIDAALYRHGFLAFCHNLDNDSLYVRWEHVGPDTDKGLESDTTTLPGGIGRFGIWYRDFYTLPLDTVNVCYPDCPPLYIPPPFPLDCPPQCRQLQ